MHRLRGEVLPRVDKVANSNAVKSIHLRGVSKPKITRLVTPLERGTGISPLCRVSLLASFFLLYSGR